jgi:hypothetical protein
VTELPATLGRRPGHGPTAIQISDSKKISKLAASIEWNEERKSFMLKRLGKTKVHVNKQLVNAGSELPIEHKAAISIGTCNFYFLRPKEPV